MLSEWIALLLQVAANGTAIVLSVLAFRDGRKARRTAHEARNVATTERLRRQMDARRYGRRRNDDVQRD